MIEVTDLNNEQIDELIQRLNYGHLACCDDERPYVVPIHYAYKDGYIYVYTTEGKKSGIITNNPRICLQIEEVKSNQDWVSVIIYGEAQELLNEDERTEAIESILHVNPTLTPAVSIHWMDNWIRENIEVVYRILPLETTGRQAVARSETKGTFIPPRKADNSVH